MSTTTTADVRGMFARYVDALASAGADVSGYYLEEGDSVSAWRVWCPAGAGRTGGAGAGDYGYLGDTKREAYRALFLMASVLEDVRYATKEG